MAGRFLLVVSLLVALLGAPQKAIAQQPAVVPPAPPALTVFAADSLQNVLDDLNAIFAERTGIKVTARYAASAALAKQLEQGAAADVFIPADTESMDYGAQKKVIQDRTRFNLLGNRLVLIAPKDSTQAEVAIGPGFDLAKLAGDGKIATGDVQAEPSGKYAKAALEKLGAWQAAAPKFAMADTARAAVTLVARGEAALGIVYETDAKIEPGVKVIGKFPADSHPPIIYPAALTVTAKPEAKRYLDFLRGATGQVGFEHYGFTYLVKAGP